MKNKIFLVAILFLFNCSTNNDEDEVSKDDKLYLFKYVEVINGVQNTKLYSPDDCQSKTSIKFETDNKLSWDDYLNVNCENYFSQYDYDPVNKKIQISSDYYYTVKFENNINILQGYLEVNNDPNYTEYYYFKKK